MKKSAANWRKWQWQRIIAEQDAWISKSGEDSEGGDRLASWKRFHSRAEKYYSGLSQLSAKYMKMKKKTHKSFKSIWAIIEMPIAAPSVTPLLPKGAQQT